VSEIVTPRLPEIARCLRLLHPWASLATAESSPHLPPTLLPSHFALRRATSRTRGTETQIFKEEPIHDLIAGHAGHSVWGAYARRLTEGGEFEPPKAGGKDDGAHPPIHPLRPAEQGQLQSVRGSAGGASPPNRACRCLQSVTQRPTICCG